MRLVPSVMWNVCRLSGSGFLQILIDTSSYIGLVRVISTFGSEALAGYTIGIRLVIFAMMPAWGLGNAAATMVGQALGARKPERAEEVGVDRRRSTTRSCLAWSARRSSSLRRRSSRSTRAIRRSCRMRSAACGSSAPGFVFFAYGLVLTQAFNGAGDTWTPTWINLGCFWVWQIPLAWLLAIHLEMGPQRRVHRDDRRVFHAGGRQRRYL